VTDAAGVSDDGGSPLGRGSRKRTTVAAPLATAHKEASTATADA